MARRVKIPYSIPGGASGFLWMDVDTTGGVSMPANATSASGSASALRVVRKTTPGADTFVVPDNVNVVYLSGCGGGGGGGGGFSGGASAAGGGGGGPAPMIWLLPVLVTPGTTIDTFVGSGGSAGAASDGTTFTAAANGNGGDGTESYISGAGILSPYKNGSNQILMGYGRRGFGGNAANTGTGSDGIATVTHGDGGSALMASSANFLYGTINTGAAHASRWWYTDGQIPMAFMLPICQGSGGGATNASGGSRGSAGFISISGSGLGLAGTGTAAGGGGGGGGGGGYGRGGSGGNAPGGAAGAGVGYGYGGGGGAGQTTGTGGVGTVGGNGIIELWY